tara:strand:- start:115 stop:1242 length:1128 start_codon:yes stop_codon:yes gene_type:complete
MGFTKAVSNIIKGAVTNKILGELTSNFADQQQTKKLAAKIADKSPLDIDLANNAHMRADNNPFKYGLLYYPQETQNLGDGHYVIFDIIMNQISSFERQTFDSRGKLVEENFNRLGERSNRIGRRIKNIKGKDAVQNKDNLLRKMRNTGFGDDSNKFLADSILMYTPPTVKFDYTAEYENADTQNLANIKDFMSKTGDGFTGVGDLLKEGSKVGEAFLQQVSQAALEVAFPGAAGFFTKVRGKAINPRMELAFKSVPFRTFTFEFEFAPKNQIELDMQHKIIQLFKFHMLPETSDQKYLITPSEFQITYMYRDNMNNYIPKISRCALTNMNVDYSPEGVFTTFKRDDRGAAPVITKMSLQFTEMEIMTKETIATGH